MPEPRRARRNLIALLALLVLLLSGGTWWAVREADVGAGAVPTVADDSPGEAVADAAPATDVEPAASSSAAVQRKTAPPRPRVRAEPPVVPKPRAAAVAPPAPKPAPAEDVAAAPTTVAPTTEPAAAAAIELYPPDKQASSSYGAAVAIDVDLAAVGDPGALVGQATAGAVFVFERRGAMWVLDARLTSPIGAQGDQFGRWVAVSAGRVFVCGDRMGRTERAPGAVYVFERVRGHWQVAARLDAPSDEKGRGFAGPLSASGDLVVAGNDARAALGKSAESGAHLLGRTMSAGWAVETPLTWKDVTTKETRRWRLGAGVACAPPFFAATATSDEAVWDRKGSADAGRVVVWTVDSLTQPPSELAPPAERDGVLMGSVAAAAGAVPSTTCRVAAAALATKRTSAAPFLVTWRHDEEGWSGPSTVELPAWTGSLDTAFAAAWPWPVAMDGRLLVAGIPVIREKKGRAPVPAAAGDSRSAVAVFVDDGTSWTAGPVIWDPARSRDPLAFGTSVALSQGTLVVGATSPAKGTPGTAWIIDVATQ